MSTTNLATIMQTPERHGLDVLRNVSVEVDDHGEIVSIEAAGPDADADVVLPSEHGYAFERFAMSDTNCPLSNAYFANVVFPARRALEAGVRVRLGTDVAGGAQPGLLPQCADAVTMSQLLDDGVDPRVDAGKRGVAGSRISITDAFWMATAGGAELLGLDVGILEVGRQFDAVAVDTARSGSPLRTWDGIDDDERTFEKIVRLTTPADITGVWVAGNRVVGVN